MQSVVVPIVDAAAEWRKRARALAAEGVAPEEVVWSSALDAPSLFQAFEPASDAPGGAAFTVPAAFIRLVDSVVCHRDPARFGLLFRVLWRLQETPRLLADASDRDIAALRAMDKAVQRDCHKMKAFVRFKDVGADQDAGDASATRRRFAAWFEPDHFIVERTAPFFARRFGDMDWLIATPYQTVRAENGRLALLPGAERPELAIDAADDLWRTYFASIFNPARLKVKAMQAEMPKKYWRNLPEAELIPTLIAAAGERVVEMRARDAAAPPRRAIRLKERAASEEKIMKAASGASAVMPASLEEARHLAAACERCALHCRATQTVFGEGPEDADLMFVGEQPGDQEDLQGRPFVGPAGKLFDQVLGEAGIERERCYVTNAVKHFKFQPRGKRRLHQRPNAGEVEACRWWLDLERRLVRPKLLVALGATAALALTGNQAGIMKRRGRFEDLMDGGPDSGENGARVLLTVHPSYLLRIPDPEAAASARAAFRDDLQRAAEFMSRQAGSG
jgi:DNA polymerase